MPEVKWTKEQECAILKKDSNLLVAAAAGSGKTAVLVERIINKIVNENVDIDKLLVVTFTNAAASEMRERILDAIYKKIEENPLDIKLQRQINLLNKANICTIHSFCLEIIRNYFYELDISANFRIADTAEIELLKQDVLEDLFEEKYINQDKSFLKLLNTYTTYRGDEPLKDLILKIYNFIQSAPFPKKWLEEKVEMFNLKDELNKDYAKTVWGKILLYEYKTEVTQNRVKLETLKNKMSKFEELDKFTNTIESDIIKLKEIEDLICINEANLYDKKENLWDKLYFKVNELKFDTWPRDSKCTITLKDDAKSVRDRVKKDIDCINKKIFIYDSENANKDIYLIYDNLLNLKDIINEFSDSFQEKKKEKNIIDFHDIEHFALEILLKEDENGNFISTEVANKLKQQYIEIAVDEYQDSNMAQEYILNSISNGNNIFMVGDVKQSIYKFRQAMPELFLNKYQNYKLINDENESNKIENNYGRKIQLFKNFRSRKNVLDITNIIFEQIMSRKLGDIDYTQDEYLNLGANYEEPEEKINYAGKTELHIIDLEEETSEQDIWKNSVEELEDEKDNIKEQEEPVEKVLLEAKFVANKIKDLLKSDYKVFDKKIGYRNIQCKDIVILLRSTANVAPIYEKELSEQNIPTFSDSSAEYLDSVEIQTIMSVLRIIDNPLQDIPLITVLRSSIANYTDNDLVQIRLADRSQSFYNSMLKARISVQENLKNKIDSFLNLLDKWKKEQEIYTLDELIWQIYMDSNYYNYVGLLNNGKLRQANLKMLFEKARQYETASFKGLYNFINFIDKLKTSSKDMQAAKIIGENDDVVRIMSIHKSKGLEFPVVFLCRSDKQFNLQDLNDDILLHQDLGFGPKYINYEKRIQYNTLAKEALRIKLKAETISEEMRILYVALTRAKEKLFIIGVEKDYRESIKEKEELLTTYNENKINVSLLKKYKSYLGWIELVYLNNKLKMNDIIDVYRHSHSDLNFDNIQSTEKPNIIELLKLEVENNKSEKNLSRIKNMLNWEYEYKLSQEIPTKTSVSKIKQENNSDKTNLTNFLIQDTQNEDQELSLSIPKFNKEEKITGAQKGTLVHLCIKNLDESKIYTYDMVKQLIENLQDKRIITEKEAQAININSILQFTKSELFKDLKNAKEVHKEEAFYINISAKDIYDIDADENVLVQGIIDLYYINQFGDIILVDYKTDYVQNENELVNKYSDQLNLYKNALEKALGVKVKKVAIYSIYLQKEIVLS